MYCLVLQLLGGFGLFYWEMMMNKKLHNLCEDKAYMEKMDALPLEPWAGQKLTPEQLEMWHRGQNAYQEAFKQRKPKEQTGV